eukprot:768779-Amphidinium_carterae.1
MKKNTMLQLKVQPSKKARDLRADHSRTKVVVPPWNSTRIVNALLFIASRCQAPAPDTQKTPLRTALKSQAPLFQP